MIIILLSVFFVIPLYLRKVAVDWLLRDPVVGRRVLWFSRVLFWLIVYTICLQVSGVDPLIPLGLIIPFLLLKIRQERWMWSGTRVSNDSKPSLY